MSADDRGARIDAIAAKALMLAPGDTFAVPVSGDEREVERALTDIERAIERQYDAGRDMLPVFDNLNVDHLRVLRSPKS